MGTAASVLEGGGSSGAAGRGWARTAGGGSGRCLSEAEGHAEAVSSSLLAGVWWRRTSLPGLVPVSADEAEPSLWRRRPALDRAGGVAWPGCPRCTRALGLTCVGPRRPGPRPSGPRFLRAPRCNAPGSLPACSVLHAPAAVGQRRATACGCSASLPGIPSRASLRRLGDPALRPLFQNRPWIEAVGFAPLTWLFLSTDDPFYAFNVVCTNSLSSDTS